MFLFEHVRAPWRMTAIWRRPTLEQSGCVRPCWYRPSAPSLARPRGDRPQTFVSSSSQVYTKCFAECKFSLYTMDGCNECILLIGLEQPTPPGVRTTPRNTAACAFVAVDHPPTWGRDREHEIMENDKLFFVSAFNSDAFDQAAQLLNIEGESQVDSLYQRLASAKTYPNIPNSLTTCFRMQQRERRSPETILASIFAAGLHAGLVAAAVTISTEGKLTEATQLVCWQ
jgi:hypothetical protein